MVTPERSLLVGGTGYCSAPCMQQHSVAIAQAVAQQQACTAQQQAVAQQQATEGFFAAWRANVLAQKLGGIIAFWLMIAVLLLICKYGLMR